MPEGERGEGQGVINLLITLQMRINGQQVLGWDGQFGVDGGDQTPMHLGGGLPPLAGYLGVEATGMEVQ